MKVGTGGGGGGGGEGGGRGRGGIPFSPATFDLSRPAFAVLLWHSMHTAASTIPTVVTITKRTTAATMPAAVETESFEAGSTFFVSVPAMATLFLFLTASLPPRSGYHLEMA